MYTALATDLLLGKEGASERYLGTVPTTAMKMVGSKDVKVDSQTKEEAHHPIFDCVVKGDKESIIREVKKEVEAGEKPSAVIEKYLIPGINQWENITTTKSIFSTVDRGSNAMKEANGVFRTAASGQYKKG